MIYKETLDKNSIDVNLGEIVRYLGYANNTPDEKTYSLIDKISKEVKNALNLSACFTMMDIETDKNAVDFKSFCVSSKSLFKNLNGCKKCLLFCATAGTQVDRIILKYESISVSAAVVAQAVGTAFVEEWCNVLLNKIQAGLYDKKLYLRPRFSAGYGDFDIMHQKDIFKILNPEKNIGVCLTDSLLMTPIKSVSAVVGISDKDSGCKILGCENCEKSETCTFSRR